MHNSAGHAIKDDVKTQLMEINTELRMLLKHATGICQPADFFIIRKVKTTWSSL